MARSPEVTTRYENIVGADGLSHTHRITETRTFDVDNDILSVISNRTDGIIDIPAKIAELQSQIDALNLSIAQLQQQIVELQSLV